MRNDRRMVAQEPLVDKTHLWERALLAMMFVRDSIAGTARSHRSMWERALLAKNRVLDIDQGEWWLR
ncbi:MAG: hypothetical protein WBJ75_01095, partial [Pseudohongiellaceae bacterium]